MISEDISLAKAAEYTLVTAGAGNNNSAITGQIIDRQSAGFPNSICIGFAYKTSTAANQSFKLTTVVLEHSDESDMGNAANHTLFENATGSVIAANGANAYTAYNGTKKYGVNVLNAKRYLRVKYTPVLTASGTDTCAIQCVLIGGESYKGPTT